MGYAMPTGKAEHLGEHKKPFCLVCLRGVPAANVYSL